MGRREATIVYTGQGNLRSLVSALRHCGVAVELATDSADIAAAERLIIPGVAATSAIVNYLQQVGHWQAVQDFVLGDRPLLGICAGMQVLAEHCTEGGEHSGLAVLPGRVERIPKHPGLRVPHVGWSSVVRTQQCPLPWFPEGDYYFTHSYAYLPGDGREVVALTAGHHPITAAVSRRSCVAVQFHPEKSQELGLTFLEEWNART
jgi:glutamine amidotransferase